MQVFKTALKLVFRFPVYLLLYIVCFGMIGVIIAPSIASTNHISDSADDEMRPLVAVIDRDQSLLSQGLESFVAQRSTPVAIEDTPWALQDATALNLSSYIMVIPEDYGERFVAAARANQAPPALETVVNYLAAEAVYMDMVVGEYLSGLRIAAFAWPEASVPELLDKAAEAAEVQVEVSSLTVREGISGLSTISIFFQWLSYPLTAGLIVLSAVIFGVFQSGELRRRNLCAPKPPMQTSLQVALGCAAMLLMAWLYLMLLSFLPVLGGGELLAADPAVFGLLALAALVYALVPFSIGFLFSQLGLKEILSNGLGNIVSLVFCFLSGVFVGDVSMLGENIQKLAYFIPTYWYNAATRTVFVGGEVDAPVGYLGALAVMLLFAAAIFSVALLAGRLRAQTSQAGGNPAAEVVR